MSHKPSYEELEKRIKELEKEALMRKWAQDEANVQQETLARVFEVAPYIMMLVDKDCRVTNINDKCVAFLSKPHGGILGLLCGEVFSCLNSFDGLGCGSNEECANCPVRTGIMYTFETGQDICDAEGRLAVRKGSTDVAVDVLISTALVKDRDANKVLVTITDITERKRAQDELFNSRQMLRTVLDYIPQRVFWKDRNSVFVGCNKPFALDCGYEEPGEIVGKTSYETASAAIADLYHADDREVMESGRPKINYEEPQIKPDGTRAWLITSKVPMCDQDGQVIGVLGTYSDITRRKLMEEQIRQTNSYLENILENSPDSIAIVDKHGRFIRWNKMAEDLYGYTFEDMKGQSAYALYADKDDLEKMLVRLRGEGSVKKWEMRMERKDGSIAPFEISISVLKDSQNETLGSVCVARDLSEIKETLAAVRASNDQLNREIIEHERSEKALKESEEMYRVLFVGSSHGILAADIETKRFVFANPSICHMLGYTENELLDLGIEDIHPKDSLNLVLSELESQLRGEKKLASALPCLRKDGTVFFADVTAELTSIHGRKLTVGFFSDVTERKRAREQIESIARFPNENPGPILRISRDGKLLYANRGSANVLKSLGWKRGATITGDWRQHALQTLSSGCSKEMELTCEGLVYSLKLVPVSDFGYLNIYGQDITEQKQAQESLRENEAMYRTLVENIPQKVFMKDADSFYVSINGHFARDLGIQSADVFGKTDYDFFPRELADKYRADDKRVTKTGVTEELEEHYVSQGKEVWVQTVKTPVRDVSGKIVGVFGTFWDITERKQAEEALSLRESYLTAILENQPGLVWLKDKEGRFLAVNETFARTCSMVRPEDVLGKTDLDIWPRELAEKYRNDDKAVLTTGAPIAVEEVINDRGEVKWFETFKTPVLDKDGQILGTSGYARDITERKGAEEALRESEALYRTLVNLSPDAISVADLNGLLTFTSPKATQMFGDSPDDEIRGRSLLCWVAPEEHEKVSTNIMHLMTEGTLNATEYTLVKKDGTRFIGEINAAVIHSQDGSPMRMIVITRDVTERKRAEEALRLSERRLRRAEVVACFGNWEFIRGCDKVKASEGAKIIYGLEGSEWSIAEVQRVSLAEHRGMLDKALNGLIEEGKPYNVEFKIRRPSDGKILDIHSIAEYSHEKGVVFGVIQDISERQRAKEEKEKLEAQLFQAQKMESVGRLAGGVAHDFNNMLGVIIGRAEMALQQDVSNNKLQHNLQEILNAGLRSADLTRQLLAFARKQAAVPKILDLNDTISGMLKMLRRLIGEDIDLSWQPGFDLWKVKIDPSQVDQILANLVVNSRDAISGVGAITILTENVVIDDSYRVETPEFIPGEYVLLTVTDTGAGISQEVRENIFEPFFTTKEVGKGTGLGLSTVYGIVKQNDGFIYVASELGKGTTFKIYLPRFEAKTAQVASEEIARERPTGTETVLLAEDDGAMLNLGKVILEDLGYTVIAAQTPVQAIHLAQDHPGDIHLLITDVVMPEMNGRELAKQLRACRPKLKCLYMSGFTADVIAHRGILDEGVGFIQKPFLSDDFAGKVRQVLDNVD